MIARAGSGWQTVLADLSLILFMVTAAALSQANTERPEPKAASELSPISPQGAPLALYRAEAGAPPLAEWLASQAADSRQQLTIVAQYRLGDQSAALAQAEALAREAGEAGTGARIVIEPGEGGTTAALAFDVPSSTLARSLLHTGNNSDSNKDRP